ncbi:MAG TPA: alpha-E domain-containing protein [Ktedonosporobacter sp.]|nr:alpha-E domain-containing protein [Ktedonosporobacter sp.]
MLSRVADNLYWMSRYLERAEHTARLIDVSLHQMLDHRMQEEQPRWQRLRASLSTPATNDKVDSSYSITELFTFETSTTTSIGYAIAAARENARQVREQISSEMWEQINRLYLQIKQTSIDELWFAQPHAFFSNVKEGVQLFRGITDATMNHSEGWHFIRVGNFIERASATSTLLDVHYQTFFESEQSDHQTAIDHLNYQDWVGLLRSCASFEAYCKVYTAASIQPERIAEFLLFNAESPRSIYFAAGMSQTALQSIARATHIRRHGRVERLAGRLRAGLEYDQVEDITQDIHAYLENIQRQCSQIHNAIYQTYMVYPIDVALRERASGRA